MKGGSCTKQRKKKSPLSPSRLIALVFAGLILLGTALLCLPFASRSGSCCGFRTALFTATSCTCVTGLVLADTWTQWSGFGQTVILILIEIGGLGFMSAASLFVFAFRRKISMQQQMVIAQSIGLEGIGDTVRLQKRILQGCFLVEGVGAILLTLRFLGKYSFLTALKLGVFHSISAFCNAGFDILGFESPGSSLIPYGTDPVICLTLSALIVIGGVGFLVWDELFRIKSRKKLSVYSRLVLIATGLLLIVGTVLICAAEWRNPGTLGGMTFGEKLTAGFFQSATTRTAGFAGIDQGAMTDAGKAITIFLMLIGGSSGSTAGGLKTVTFVVLVLFLWSRVRGKTSVEAFHRTISHEHVLNALTIFGLMTGLTFAGAVFICATCEAGFTDALYETVSALATVGLTTGITPALPVPAQYLLILYMYFGRIGLLTISLGFLQENRGEQQYRYAKTNLLIG